MEGETYRGSQLSPEGMIVAAHELKSPLGAIRQIGLLLEDESLSDNERRYFGQRLQIITERALQLTGDLTQLSRLNEELFPLEPVNPLSLFQTVALDMAPRCQAEQRTVRVPRAKKRAALVVANRQLLGRVIANFVDNALHYTAEGDVSLSVRKARDGRLRLAVRDRGPAMTRRQFQRLQADMLVPKPVHARPGSSGLGVYIAGQFAKTMHCDIGLSRHKDGLSFYIDVPQSGQMSLL